MESEESEKSEEKNKCEKNEGNTGCENHVEGKIEENVKEEKKFSKKRERYQVNDFEVNEDANEKNEPTDTYYIRPFIPFWSLQSLRFEDVNSCNEIPTQRDKTYPRYVMEKLVKTWLKRDKEWFDKKEIFEILEEDIADMLDSRFTAKREMPRNLCGISEFKQHRTLILDCWAIYHHINFQSEHIDIDINFNFFPLWKCSADFEFNLYYEVKRVSLADEPLTIMDGEKRLWIKEEEMSSDIYEQHLKPTVFNKDFEILTTQHYVPKYLRGILSKSLESHSLNCKYIQINPVIIRRTQQRLAKRAKMQKPKKGKSAQNSGEMLESMINENVSEIVDDDAAEQSEGEMEKCEERKKQLNEEELTKKEEWKKQVTAGCEKKVQDLLETIERMKEESIERMKSIEEKDLKILEQRNRIDELKLSAVTQTQTLRKEIERLNKLLTEQKEENDKFTDPIDAKVINLAQSRTMTDFIEYARKVSETPNNMNVKIRAVRKYIDKIRKYQKNTDDLYKRFDAKMKKAANDTDMDNLVTELEYRAGHNQYQINLIKIKIQVYLDHKYDHKFDGLVEVIPNLNRFMCHLKKYTAEWEKLSCPDDILSMNVLEQVEQHLEEPAEIRYMTPEENYMYRNLIVDENIDKIVRLKKISDTITDEEREKKLNKKYHDNKI